MFQYVFARLLAEHFGYAMEVPPLMGLPNILPGKRYDSPTERLSDAYDRDGMVVDAVAVFTNPAQRRILLDGLFQQSSIYEPYRDKIRGWFKDALPPLSSKELIVVHARFCDYEDLGWTLPGSYYTEAIKRAKAEMPHCGVCILSDSPKRAEQYFSFIKQYSPRFVHNDSLCDLRLIVGADMIICSNSSFAWWGAFLSKTTRVWMPHNWQPWGISQAGDRHWQPGKKYPTDLRLTKAGWNTIDMTGGMPRT